MRRICFFVLILSMLVIGCANGEQFSVAAKGAVIIEAETGRVLYAQNCDEMLPMASTTKIMTCLLALENGALESVITAPKEACGIEGTSIYLTEGEHLTLEQLLYGLMLRSGNDAAAAIAMHIAGSQDDFVEMMNQCAEELGVDAHFENPHGLDAPGHGASAKALALIMRECIKHDDFLRISGTEKKLIPWEGNEYSRVLYNKNKLLKSYEGTLAGKTGYTKKAGRCLIFAAERNGMRLIGCVLNCSTWFDTSEKLLDAAFENYYLETVFSEGECIEQIEVIGGQEDEVGIVAAEELSLPLGTDEDYVLQAEILPAEAPVKAGTTAGVARVFIDDVEVCSVELVYDRSVAENDLEAAVKRILGNWILRLE